MIQVLQDLKACKNFKLSKFLCKGGLNKIFINENLLEKLYKLKTYSNELVIVQQVCRSPPYNKN